MFLHLVRKNRIFDMKENEKKSKHLGEGAREDIWGLILLFKSRSPAAGTSSKFHQSLDVLHNFTSVCQLLHAKTN